MTREEYEQSTIYAMNEDLPKGPGDPEVHGHYPGDPDEKYCKICNPDVPIQPKHKTSDPEQAGQ